MTTIVMPIEGVLVDRPLYDSMLNYEATDEGRDLFNLLKSQGRLILLSSDPSEDRVKAWLIRERLVGYSQVYVRPANSTVEPNQWRIDRMVEMMGIGHRISYYVDTDPVAIGKAMDLGVTSLLLGIPGTRPGQEKGSAGPSPWYSLVQRVEAQNTLRAEMAQRESENSATSS